MATIGGDRQADFLETNPMNPGYIRNKESAVGQADFLESDTDSPAYIKNNPLTAKSLTLLSSTADSTKKFVITVDDDGEITATEVTEGE